MWNNFFLWLQQQFFINIYFNKSNGIKNIFKLYKIGTSIFHPPTSLSPFQFGENLKIYITNTFFPVCFPIRITEKEMKIVMKKYGKLFTLLLETFSFLLFLSKKEENNDTWCISSYCGVKNTYCGNVECNLFRTNVKRGLNETSKIKLNFLDTSSLPFSLEKFK